MVKPRVAILVPASDLTPTVFWVCFLKLIEWIKSGDDFDLVYQISTTKPLDKARDRLVTFALTQNADYMLFLDSDMVFDKRILHKLYAHKKDIVSAMYFAKTYPYRPVARARDKDTGKYEFVIDYPEKSLMKVAGGGMGACLINTRVVRKMVEPYFTFDKGFGEDIYFCRQAENLGFEIWLDTSQMLRHFGGIGLGHESFEYVRKKMRDNPPVGVTAEEIDKKLRSVQEDILQSEMPLNVQQKETIPETVIFDTERIKKSMDVRLLNELIEYTKLPEQEVLMNMANGVRLIREEFLTVNPKTDEEIESFYRTCKNYLWDLGAWHSLIDKQRQNRTTLGLVKATYPKAKKVLDYGCGIGEMGFLFAKAGYDVTMVDFPTNCMDFAQFRAKNYPPVNIITFDHMRANMEKYRGQFDVILCFDVLEHLTINQLKQVVNELIELRSPIGDVLSVSGFGWGTGKTGSHPMHFDMDDERRMILQKISDERRGELDLNFNGKKQEVMG